MAILMGVDFGEKRVGLARSDESETVAEALATLSYQSREDLLTQLKPYLEDLHPQRIVVGLPQTIRGEIGPAAKKVLEFVEWFKKRLPLEWVFWDERFTTVEAERVLLEADLSRNKRRALRDSLAAQRILQSYLEGIRNV